jgi:membrane protease YdiL (CAAX protease family)
VTNREASSSRLYQLSLSRPILVSLVLLAIAVLLRIVDIFLLPIAEATGEAILHKALGLALVVAYVWAAGPRLAAIGLHGRWVGKAAFIGASGPVIILILGFGLQWAVSHAADEQAALVVAAVDYTTGLAKPGLGFALWLLLGNVVNSSMEEGLFRGIMLPHFRRRLSPWQANILQAVIFGLWHLAWPIQHWMAGRIDLATAVSQAVPWVLGATISGLAYGYLFLKTDSLWAPWTMHTVNNTLLNLVHIRTAEGLDANTGILYAMVAVGYLASLLWTKVWAKRLRMPELGPWGGSGNQDAAG